MKFLIIILIFILNTSLFAADGCANNPYTLTKEDLVVAFDWEENAFTERTGQRIIDAYFFNELVDSSCVRIEVKSKVISCVSSKGVKKEAGSVQDVDGAYGDWTFYTAKWSDNVSIISEESRGSCRYGVKIE